MQNIFLELVSSPLMNLDHTYRYSGTKLVEPESLSQHIVDTLMMGMKIVEDINTIAPGSLSLMKYFMKAIYHDLEEVITGDVPRPLKYHDEDTLTSMRNVADEVAHELFNEEFKESSEYHYDKWVHAKDEDEGFILKIVDNLVVVHKVVKEVSLLNNYYMLRVAYEVIQYTADLKADLSAYPHFNNPKIDNYIQDLLGDAISCMEDILEEHQDKLPLCSHSML